MPWTDHIPFLLDIYLRGGFLALVLVCLASVKKYLTLLWSECIFLVLFSGIDNTGVKVREVLSVTKACLNFLFVDLLACDAQLYVVMGQDPVLIPPFHRLLPSSVTHLERSTQPRSGARCSGENYCLGTNCHFSV